jgi:mRNA interferase MazF
MKYGDIVLVAGGAYTSKPRPVLVVQNQKFKTGDSVIVVPFTSVDNPDIDTRIAVSSSPRNGLDRSCFLEIDKLSAVRSSYIGDCIGTLENTLLNEVHSKVVELLSP